MKVVLTGHTRGLGAALAENLLQRGFRVLGLARAGNADLASRFPDLLQQVELDLSDSAAVAGWLAGGLLQAYLAAVGLGRADPVNPTTCHARGVHVVENKVELARVSGSFKNQEMSLLTQKRARGGGAHCARIGKACGVDAFVVVVISTAAAGPQSGDGAGPLAGT